VQPVPIPAPVQAFAPDFSRRVGLILASLIAIIARRFVREPRLAALAIPLCARLTRAARRCARLMAGLAAGRPSRPRKPGRRGGAHPNRLPTGRGWLVRALGYEVAGCASQLAALLAEPAAAALLALLPAIGRILRPIVHMLTVPVAIPRRRPAPVATAPVAAPLFEPFGKVAFRSQGYTWYVVPTPPANSS